MKLDRSKLTNPVFWVGVISVVFMAADIDPKTLITWSAVWESLLSIAKNPYTVVMVGLAVYAQFNDNGLKGLDVPFKNKLK